MNRIRLVLLTLVAGSVLFAQNPAPDAVRLMNSQWSGGAWKTIQYTLQATSGYNKSTLTVAIEAPNRMRAELKGGIGGVVTVVSDGESTWLYNSDMKQQARMSGSRYPIGWLARLDEMLIRNMTGAMESLIGAGNWQNLTTLRAERVKVGRDERDCWVVSGNVIDLGPAWNSRTIWIDRYLMIPLKFRTQTSRGGEVKIMDAQVTSLRIDEAIPASTFTFTAPKGAEVIPVPSQLLSRASDEDLPDGRTLMQDLWNGEWRTIQYTAEASSALVSGRSARRVLRTKVALEKPDRIRVEIRALKGPEEGQSLLVVSDHENIWLSNRGTLQYQRLFRSPQNFDPQLRLPEPRSVRFEHSTLLTNLDNWVNLQLSPYRVHNNPELLTEVVPVGQYILPAVQWTNAVTLRSETVAVGSEERDCWVVIADAFSDPVWGPHILWIDKKLRIPLRFGKLSWSLTSNFWSRFFPSPDPNGTNTEPDFAGQRVLSLKVDEAIPTGTFEFKPRGQDISPR